MSPKMTKVVLGGGISGLSAGYYLRKKFPLEKIIILEGSSRTGGWIKSTRKDGYIFEQGPRTIRPKGPRGINTLQLIEELGLESKLYPIPSTHPAALKRMIYANGQLHVLPSNLLSVFKTQSPFSKPLINFILNDLIVSKKSIDEKDEPIYDFIERRFGKEIADYAISPLICGVCAGNAKEISVKFLIEDLFDKEQKYGSVIKGILYSSFGKSKPHIIHSTLSKKAKQDKWSIYSFTEGLETLPKALENTNRQNRVDFILNTPCHKIKIKNNKITLETATAGITANHLISSIPANILGNLIEGHPELTKLLNSITAVDVCVINLHYEKRVLPMEAFGFLVPPKENLPILGVIFDSCCFSFENNTVLTVMMGGHWFKKHFGNNPTEGYLLNIALNQIQNILGIKEEPNSFKINILQKCIPQYVVGHNNTVNQINTYIKDNNLPLSLCGASYYGVGVNDVIWSAKSAVESL